MEQPLWHSSRVSDNIKHPRTHDSGRPLLGNSPGKNGNLGSYKNLHTHVHSSSICNDYKVQATRGLPTGECTKQPARSPGGAPLSKHKEPTIDTCNMLEASHAIMLSQKSQS